MVHLKDFVTRSLFTCEMFDELMKENTPGYTLPWTTTIFVAAMMRNDPGIMRETVFEDPLNAALGKMKRAGFGSMTNVERLNQGELVYGFMTARM